MRRHQISFPRHSPPLRVLQQSNDGVFNGQYVVQALCLCEIIYGTMIVGLNNDHESVEHGSNEIKTAVIAAAEQVSLLILIHIPESETKSSSVALQAASSVLPS